MNINKTALKALLETNNPDEILTDYLLEDYKLLANKAKGFYQRKGEMPSVRLLGTKAKSFGAGSTKDEAKKHGEKLYKLVDSLHNTETDIKTSELNELIIDSYKQREIINLNEKIAEASLESDWDSIIDYSSQIEKINQLSCDDDFLTNDDKDTGMYLDKDDVRVSTGIYMGEFNGLTHTAPSSVITILAPSGFGKSLLALQSCINNFLIENKNVMYISYELPKSQLFARIYAYITKVPISNINENSYSCQEEKDKMAVVDYVLQKQISLGDAITLYRKVKQESSHQDAIQALKELPDRKNILKLIASTEKKSYEIAMKQGKRVTELPNDRELVTLLSKYGETLDDIYIDYISEVSFTESLSRELNITNLSREIKAKALKYGFNTYLLSQVENEKNAYGAFEPKYAKSLVNISDVVLVAVGTKSLKKDGLIYISGRKVRNGEANKSYLFEADYETQTFEFTEEESISMFDLQIEMAKEFKKAESKN